MVMEVKKEQWEGDTGEHFSSFREPFYASKYGLLLQLPEYLSATVVFGEGHLTFAIGIDIRGIFLDDIFSFCLQFHSLKYLSLPALVR